ncbi:uncharacterized protein LOC117342715 [Pecten maximus]|uniref:uncharacterized protein LOC117342715 n=1 Tax=Pecten maximus TaxID=6579 RepID=UPI0014586729|nr:uncharacterized protein LOC117342715 [Pecten maximus]XP_033760824.1 uncharacterized protein LOC117342715 [Pecten maximus]
MLSIPVQVPAPVHQMKSGRWFPVGAVGEMRGHTRTNTTILSGIHMRTQVMMVIVTPTTSGGLRKLRLKMLSLLTAPESTRFVGTYSNEKDDEFYSIASTEYLSLDEDLSPRMNSENQKIQLTFPKMALKLNLDVTVSEFDPTTGKMELLCSTGDKADTCTVLETNGNITNCEMWLNGQYLLSEASRSSSSDIDLNSQGLFPEFENCSSENLQSFSDSKLSCDTKTTNASDRFNVEPLMTRLDHVRKHYRLFDFSDEETSIFLNKQIEESSHNLDRLIAWYNEGCKSDLSSHEPYRGVSEEGMSRPKWIHMNENCEEREAKSSSFVPETASAEDIVDLPDMPHLPSLPSSPLPSHDSLGESRDSFPDTATTCEGSSVQFKGARASWLTIYKSSMHFDQQDMIHSGEDMSTRSDITPSMQTNPLFYSKETTEADDIKQQMLEGSFFDSDEEAWKSHSLENNSDVDHCVETPTNSLNNYASSGFGLNKNEELYEQTEINRLKNYSSSTLFDSAFGSMLQDVSGDAESYTNVLPTPDTPVFEKSSAGHGDEKPCQINDSRISVTQTDIFHLGHALNIPSDKHLASYPSLNNCSYGSHSPDNIDKTEKEEILSTLLSKESNYEEPHYQATFVKEDTSCAGDFNLSGMFDENAEHADFFADKARTQCLSYKSDDTNSEDSSLFVLSSEEKRHLFAEPEKGDSRAFITEKDDKLNEEKLRVLAMSYGLLDDTEVGYESYDSDDSNISVEKREENTSLSLSDCKLDDDADSEVVSAVDVDERNGPVDKERSPDGNEIPYKVRDECISGQTRSNITSFTTKLGDIPDAASSASASNQESSNGVSTKSSSTNDVLDSFLWENITRTGPADEIEKKLDQHKQSKNFQNEDALFSFCDEDQINFLGKFQCYIESLDMGVYDTAWQNQQTNTSVDDVDDDDGGFSSFCENKANECNMQKFLGNAINTSKSDASDINSITDCSNLLENIALKMATKIVSDYSLTQRKSNETIQNLSEETVESARSTDMLNVHSSDGSIKTDNEKHSLPSQNSDQNVRSTSSTVFTCPYFDDIWRLDLVTSSAEDMGRWPVSTFSVSDLASRSHSQVIDILNCDKNVELLEYSLDNYKEDDDDDEEITNAKSALESTQLLAWVSEPNKTSQSEFASQQNNVSDTLSQQGNVNDPTTKNGRDCDQRSESKDVCEKVKRESSSKEYDSYIDITRISSDRFSYSVKAGTFLQHDDYDIGKRDSSKGPVMAAIEHEALAQYAKLLVKTVISDAHKKFVWSKEGRQINEKKSEEPVSLRSATLLPVKTNSSECKLSNQDEMHRTEIKHGESCKRSLKNHRDKNSNVFLTTDKDEINGMSSSDYCRTVVAAGLSSIAIRQGMNELRLIACKEWHSTRPESKQASSSTSSCETEPEVDKYTRYKSKLRELKMQRQRGGGRRIQNMDQKNSVSVDKKSKFVQQQSESSSDETSDDSSVDDEDEDEIDKDSFAALRRRIEETTIAEIEKLLDNMRMLLIARQAQHSRRIERYRRKAESSLPSPLCLDHNGYLPPSMRETDQPNNCWCSIEKAEAVRKLACEVFRGRDLENTKLCLLKIEDEHKAMRNRINAGQNLVFNTKSLKTPHSTNLEVQTKRVLQTEGEALKASLSKYLGDFENALTHHYIHGSEDSEEVKNDTQNEKEFESILSKDMDDFTKDLNRVFDGIQDEVKKDYENSENQKTTTTEQLPEKDLVDTVHQEGIPLPVKKDSVLSEDSEKEIEESVPAGDTTRLARITAQAFRLDSSREFLAEEYKQLKDNRLGVDLTFLAPEKVKSIEGEFSPLVTPRCSICKLRQKVNKVDNSEVSENIQTTDNYETRTGSSATVKRFGGHEYDVVTGCGIRKHKVSCALCKTRKEVGV